MTNNASKTITEFDNDLNQRAKAPDGDDYNRLFKIAGEQIASAERHAADQTQRFAAAVAVIEELCGLLDTAHETHIWDNHNGDDHPKEGCDYCNAVKLARSLISGLPAAPTHTLRLATALKGARDALCAADAELARIKYPAENSRRAIIQAARDAASKVLSASPAGPEPLAAALRDAIDYAAEDFDAQAEVDGANLVEWFAEWRQRAKTALKTLEG